jgi:phage baseplate assembly protein V
MHPTPQHNSPQEATRRLENLARLGTVVAVRHSAPARCRVKLGDNTTDWLPWLAARAAGSQGAHWWPPVVGEQCLVIAPGGDLAQGVALPGAYSDHMPAPSDGAAVEHTQWSEHDWAQWRAGARTVHTQQAITLEVGSACSITLEPGGITLRVGGATWAMTAGGITSSIDITAQGISAVHHVHGGVRSGPSTTEAPQ